MSTQEHGIAILGAGIFAKEAHLPALAKNSSFTLKAVYSRSTTSAQSLYEAVEALGAFTKSPVTVYSGQAPNPSLEDLLARDDIKTVILSLPITVQPAIIEQAWAAGKHVISEKPVAKDLKEATRLIERYEKEFKPKGIQWIIAEQFPYAAALVKAKDVLASGQIGDLRTFDLSVHAFTPAGSKYAETEWRKTPDYQGGFLLDGGVHAWAGLRFVAPEAFPTSIFSTSTLLQPHLPPFDTLQGVIATSIPSVHGTFTITFGLESGGPAELNFRGSKGSLRVGLFDHKVVLKGLPDPVTRQPPVLEEWSHEIKWIEEEFEAFGKALIAGAGSEEAKDVEGRSGPREAMRDVAAIEKALESGKTGQWVKL